MFPNNEIADHANIYADATLENTNNKEDEKVLNNNHKAHEK